MDALESLKIESALAAEANRNAEEDEVGQTDFLRMLVAQLENQDPLNPQDSAQFAAQLAQFSSVEQLIAVRSGIDELVANSGIGGSQVVDAAAPLDPASLVGREVVVFGSQIEVDAAQSPITVPIRTIETAVEAEVRIYDESGYPVHAESILPRDAAGTVYALAAGDHTYRFDPAAHGLREGVYAIEFVAKGDFDEDVTVLPMIQGIVTGAILAGEPSIRMGSRVFPVADILEVRARAGEIPSTAPAVQTGRGQTLLQAAPANPPRRAS